MSKIALQGDASGTGTFTIAAPNSNSNPTLTLPTSSGTVVVTGGAQTIEFAAGTAAAPSITFTGDTNTGIFSPGADTIAFAEGGAESMRIDASGNVGIGTSSPTASASNKTVTINGPSGSGALIDFKSNETLNFRIFSGSASSVLSVKTATPLIFDTNDTERMRIDSSGNVGIGTTSPNNRLTVAAGSTWYSGTFAGSGGTDRVVIGNLSGLTTVGGHSSALDAWKDFAISGTTLRFNTSDNSERARITSGGALLVGTATSISGDVSRVEISAAANNFGAFVQTQTAAWSSIVCRNNATSGDNVWVRFDEQSNVRGNIDYNRGAGLVRYNTTSDATLKNIIGDTDGQRSLEILNATRIREFAWKNDPTQKPQVGVIAQELYETYKGAVSVGGNVEKERDVTEEVEEEYTDEEGNTQTRTVTKVVGKETYTEYRPWGVDKTAFTFHLIAGWQTHEKLLKEAMTRIEALEAEVAALKGQ